MAKKSENRFEIVLSESKGLSHTSKILKDKKTGVLYLFCLSGYGGGLTVLVDKDGKPMIDTDGEAE